MEWSLRYNSDNKPDRQQISDFINNPLWENLCSYLESTYNISPNIEYSRCSAQPGWNVKYKKSGRPLCTLYPEEGFFISMVSVGSREAVEAELMLHSCTSYTRTLYEKTSVFNGSRWLMIEVSSEEILEDVKALIGLRVAKPKKK